MKKYRCVMEQEQKIVHFNGGDVLLKRNGVYTNESLIQMYASLFVPILGETEEQKPAEPPKPRTKNKAKEAFVEETKTEPVFEVIEVKEEPKIKPTSFSYSRLILLGVSTLLIAMISAYLRIHGIQAVFNIDIGLATILVVGFVLSEFAISALLLREIKSKLHHALNMVILGSIQIILLCISFMFEFSMMSNYIEKQKVDITVDNSKKEIALNSLKDYDVRIKAIQDQIAITPTDYIGKRSKLTAQINQIMTEKEAKRQQLDSLVSNKEIIDVKKQGVGFENTANLLGVKEQTITRTIIIFIAGILNILYVSLMYGFVSELKNRERK